MAATSEEMFPGGDYPEYGDVTPANSPPDGDLRHIENLVFQGGGVKGIAYLGALQALEERYGINLNTSQIQRVGGTSAGAITAFLLAIGLDRKELEQKLEQLNFVDLLDDCEEKQIFRDLLDLIKKKSTDLHDESSLVDEEILIYFLYRYARKKVNNKITEVSGYNRPKREAAQTVMKSAIANAIKAQLKEKYGKGTFGRIERELTAYFSKNNNYSDLQSFVKEVYKLFDRILGGGLFSGDKFETKLAEWLNGFGYGQDITFEQLHQLKKNPNNSLHYRIKDPYFVAVNLTTGVTQIFSYQHSPKVALRKAIRCSMSIPLFFKSARGPVLNIDYHQSVINIHKQYKYKKFKQWKENAKNGDVLFAYGREKDNENRKYWSAFLFIGRNQSNKNETIIAETIPNESDNSYFSMLTVIHDLNETIEHLRALLKLQPIFTYIYTDGGLFDNAPAWLFDQYQYLNPKLFDDNHPLKNMIIQNPKTLVFRLVEQQTQDLFEKGLPIISSLSASTSGAEYLAHLLSVVLNKQDSDYLLQNNQFRTIYINTLGVSTIDFSIHSEIVECLRRSGVKGVSNFDAEKNRTIYLALWEMTQLQVSPSGKDDKSAANESLPSDNKTTQNVRMESTSKDKSMASEFFEPYGDPITIDQLQYGSVVQLPNQQIAFCNEDGVYLYNFDTHELTLLVESIKGKLFWLPLNELLVIAVFEKKVCNTITWLRAELWDVAELQHNRVIELPCHYVSELPDKTVLLLNGVTRFKKGGL